MCHLHLGSPLEEDWLSSSHLINNFFSQFVKEFDSIQFAHTYQLWQINLLLRVKLCVRNVALDYFPR